jgi:hypothetical protein
VGEFSELQLNISDMGGRTILNNFYGGSSAGKVIHKIDLLNQAKGIYFLKLIYGKRVCCEKIVLE